MSKVRDFLVGLGILSSAGASISNTGVKLLNVRKQLLELEKKGATGREPLVSEAVGSVFKSAVKSTAAAASKKATRKKSASSAALERKRKYNRERMRRLRAKKAGK